jgi:sortase (surface protein transpeptidase)
VLGFDIVRGHRRLLLVAAAPLAALAVLILVVTSGPNSEVASPSVTPAGQHASSSDTVLPDRAGMAKSEPVSVDIPKVGAHSSLVSLGLNADNTVQVPPVTQPMQAGWYSYGPTPGEPGPAVVLGHVDGNKQEGIFYRLRELVPGDQVFVARKDGSTARFVVTKVDQVSKDSFPTDAVYGDTPTPELRLITCGGSFDHAAHSYRDNVIVYAMLQ